MELRSGTIIHKSSVSWLRPRKGFTKIPYDFRRYYIIKWRIKCAELRLQYDRKSN